jgi:hypothetical protein
MKGVVLFAASGRLLKQDVERVHVSSKKAGVERSIGAACACRQGARGAR